MTPKLARSGDLAATKNGAEARRKRLDAIEVNEAVSSYLSQLQRMYEMLEINQSQVGDVMSKFNSLELLRKQYNRNGRMDYMEMEIAISIGHLRLAIGNVFLFFTLGLTDFEIIETKHGAFGRAKGGRWTAADRMFFFFVDSAFEHLYGFWNRIAYFLNIFFNVESREDRVLFPPVIDQMNSKFKNLADDQHFKYLKEFKDKEYTEFNRKRATIVHKQCSWSAYFSESLKHVADLDRLNQLQVERDELPDFLLRNFRHAHKAVDQVVAIIRDNVDIVVE